jgi:hypothetical protein
VCEGYNDLRLLPFAPVAHNVVIWLAWRGVFA